MSVTIKDIAKIANVSHTTVSRALNDSPLIKTETKEKIKDIAKQLNYVPNINAKSLVTDKSYNIGLFFSTIDKGTSPYFFYDVVKGVNSVIKGKYNLVVKGIDEYENFNLINKRSFDGIILMSQSIEDEAFVYNALEKNIPIVVLNREIKGSRVINILSDDRVGSYKGVNYLINKGHRNIGIIEGKEGFKSTEERKQGYLDALLDNKINVNKDYIQKGSYDLESGYNAMKRLLKINNIPTAVFCCNDDMAVGAMKAANEAGLRIPEDISILGFDDNVFTQYVSPALTTIKRHIETVSSEGMKFLLKCINNKKVEYQTKFISSELIIRESVGEINSN